MRKVIAVVGLFLPLLLPADAAAGATGGPLTHRDTVLGYSEQSWSIVFDEGQNARIRLVGDGSSDLDCVVFNSRGQIVAIDSDATDICHLRFTPSWTGKFAIHIYNRGKSANEYVLSTN